MSIVSKRVVALALTIIMLISMMPTALAELTSVQVYLYGLTPTPDGEWQSERLEGSFRVLQNDEEIGILKAGDGYTLNLPTTDNVILIPLVDTIPSDFHVNASGSGVAISAGRVNLVRLMVYADKGIVKIVTDGAAEYSVYMADPDLDPQGQYTYAFATDQSGEYTIPEPLLTGVYVLHQLTPVKGHDIVPDVAFEVVQYTGFANDLTVVDVRSDTIRQQGIQTAEELLSKSSAPEPTAEPTATPVPQPETTATPVPQAEAPATPVPEQPSDPEMASVLMDVTGDQSAIGYRILLDTDVVSEGSFSATQPLSINSIAPGTYILELTVPDGCVIDDINSQKVTLSASARCLLPIGANNLNHYRFNLVGQAKLNGTIAGVANGTAITLVGGQDKGSAMVLNGMFTMDDLMAGNYRVSLELPDGLYAGEGWSFDRANGIVSASASVMYDGSGEIVLPGITAIATYAANGRVVSTSGKAVVNADVALSNAAGQTVAVAHTDQNGQWKTTEIPEGTYTVTVTQDGDTLAHGIEAKVDQNNTPIIVTVQEGNGSISVCVFNDRNKNAEFSTYDEYMRNVEIALIHVENGSEAVVTSDVTDRKGIVTFDSLPAGQYRVRVTLPVGYGFSKKTEKDGYRYTSNMMEMISENVQESDVITVNSRQKLQCGVGAMQMSGVMGHMWLDENADGSMNDNEPAVPGITVQAVGTKNGLVYETVTDANGDYAFTQLRPGSYNIVVTLPDGYGFTKYNKNNRSVINEEGVSTAARLLDLNNAKIMKDQNVGLVPTGSIQVLCFEDANYNGLLDEDEQMLPDVKCVLYKQNSNNSMATVVSDDSGVASFNCLRPGQYRLRTVLPVDGGYSYTKIAEGGNRHNEKMGVQAAAVEYIGVNVGEDVQLVVGAVIPGTISGTVYMDDNFSGMLDEGEAGTRDVTVALINAEGTTVATAKTDRNGAYTFNKMYPGQYQLSVHAAKGMGFTKPGEGSVISSQDGNIGLSAAFMLGMGEDKQQVNCGLIVPGLVDGIVWVDDNDNGSRDANEGGMTSVIVRLINDEDGTVTEVHPSANGRYAFESVIPGVYHVEYVLPEFGAFVNGCVDSEMTLIKEGTSAASQSFAIIMGGEKHFGETGALQLIPVGGYAYYDYNVNGVKDEDERLLGSMKLTFTSLRDGSVTLLDAGEDGQFETQTLRPGDYTLTIAFPYGYMMGITEVMPAPYNTIHYEEEVMITAASGDFWNQLAFGAVKPATIKGVVWMDEDADGRMDMGEAAPAGVKIELIDPTTNATIDVLYTDENGAFEASKLMPAEYTLLYTPTSDAEPSMGGDTTFHQVDGLLIMNNLKLHCDEVMSEVRLGLISYTSIGGLVWQDHNGMVEALTGAQVRLLNTAGQVLKTTLSDNDGRYQFDGLRTGTYAMDVILPENHIVVTQDDERIAGDAGAISVMSTCIGSYGKTELFNIRMGYHQLNLDIGAVGYGSLGDRCWLDLNGNGLQDTDEGGLPNMLIQLLSNGEVVAETMTDQYGFYSFNNLYPAEYTLRVAYDAAVIKPTTMRDDFKGVSSVLQESSYESIPVRVTSNGACYDADLGFVLIDPSVYPLGYGMGQAMNWSTKR